MGRVGRRPPGPAPREFGRRPVGDSACDARAAAQAGRRLRPRPDPGTGATARRAVMTWVTDLHPTKAELTSCVQCGLCLPHCPTYRLTGRDTASPRGRLMAMSAVASGELSVDESFAEIIDFCLQCRACEAVCPSLVPFGRAMEGARAEVTAQLPDSKRRLRHLLVGKALPNPALMRLATWGMRLLRRFRLDRLLPATLSRPLSGVRRLDGAAPVRGTIRGPGRLGTAAVLAGCVMEPWFGDVQR